MEPNSSGSRGPEISPNQSLPHSTEVFRGERLSPDIKGPESPRDGAAEAREIVSDGPKGDPGAQAPPAPPVPVVLDTNLATAQSSANDSQNTGNPVIAGDVELMEKEWVDKARELVNMTRNDPHEQGVAVGKLKADYIKKRYGKEIAMPNGS